MANNAPNDDHNEKEQESNSTPPSTGSNITSDGDQYHIVSLTRVPHIIDILWRFARPHTIRGTIMASIALGGRAWIENPDLMNLGLFCNGLLGLVALICANAYIVGVNQIFDVEIDKINKPYLPMASGELSVDVAWILVLVYAAVGFLIVFALKSKPLIFSLYCLALFLGSIYSVPPFRLKRYPAAAASMIMAVRGFTVNIGVYLSTRAAFGLPFEWSPAICFITIFFIVVGLVIAILKDLPDVEGDRRKNIPTLATRLGVRTMAFVGSGLMLSNYVAAILLAVFMPKVFRQTVMIPAHFLLGLSLIYKAWKLESTNYSKEAVYRYYQYIWLLFYAEYMIFPFI